jgi:hypothetical protein
MKDNIKYWKEEKGNNYLLGFCKNVFSYKGQLGCLTDKEAKILRKEIKYYENNNNKKIKL